MKSTDAVVHQQQLQLLYEGVLEKEGHMLWSERCVQVRSDGVLLWHRGRTSSPEPEQLQLSSVSEVRVLDQGVRKYSTSWSRTANGVQIRAGPIQESLRFIATSADQLNKFIAALAAARHVSSTEPSSASSKLNICLDSAPATSVDVASIDAAAFYNELVNRAAAKPDAPAPATDSGEPASQPADVAQAEHPVALKSASVVAEPEPTATTAEHEPTTCTEPETTAATATAEPEPTAAATAEPTTATATATAEPEPTTAEPEPTTTATATAEPETTAASAEPTAEPEPTTATAEPEPTASATAEPTAVSEHTAVTSAESEPTTATATAASAEPTATVEPAPTVQTNSVAKKRFLSAAFKAARFVAKPKEEEIEVAAEASASEQVDGQQQQQQQREAPTNGTPGDLGATARAKKFVLSRLAGSSKGREAVLSKTMSAQKQAGFKLIVDAINQYFGKEIAEAFQEDVVKLALKLRVLNAANVLKHIELPALQASVRLVGDALVAQLRRGPEEREATCFAASQTVGRLLAELNAQYLPKLTAVMTEKNASSITNVCSRLGDNVFLSTLFTSPEYESIRSSLAEAIDLSRGADGDTAPSTTAAAAGVQVQGGASASEGSAVDEPAANVSEASKVQGVRASTYVLLGLDGAGKTTLLYKLKLGDVVTTIPTIGFNVESLSGGAGAVTLWDVGGQAEIRPLWRHYVDPQRDIIFVVDAADASRFDEAASALSNILKQKNSNRLLVVCNKMDLPNAAGAEEIKVRLNLKQFDGSYDWSVVEASSVGGATNERLKDWMGVTPTKDTKPNVSAESSAEDKDEEEKDVDLDAAVANIESKALRKLLERAVRSKAIRRLFEKLLRLPRDVGNSPSINALMEDEDWAFMQSLMQVLEGAATNEDIVDTVNSFKTAKKSVKKQVDLKSLFEKDDIPALKVFRDLPDALGDEELSTNADLAQVQELVRASVQLFGESKPIRKLLTASVKSFFPQDAEFFDSFMEGAFENAGELKTSIKAFYREIVVEDASKTNAEDAITKVESSCASIYGGILGLVPKMGIAFLSHVAAATQSYSQEDGDSKSARSAAAGLLKNILPIVRGVAKYAVSVEEVASARDADVIRALCDILNGLEDTINKFVEIMEAKVTEEEKLDTQKWAEKTWASLVSFWLHVKSTTSVKFPELNKLITDLHSSWCTVPAELVALLRAFAQIKFDPDAEPSLQPLYAIINRRAEAVESTIAAIFDFVVFLAHPSKKDNASQSSNEIKAFLTKLKTVPDELTKAMKLMSAGLARHDDVLVAGASELWQLVMGIIDAHFPKLSSHITNFVTPIVKRMRAFYLRQAAKNIASGSESEPVAADCSVAAPAPAELAVDEAPAAAVTTEATVDESVADLVISELTTEQ